MRVRPSPALPNDNNIMRVDYEEFKDNCQQLSAEFEEALSGQELKEQLEFLADRYKTLLFLSNDEFTEVGCGCGSSTCGCGAR